MIRKNFPIEFTLCLKNKGKITRGIHHRLTEVEGERIYNSIEAIEDPIDVAVFVVNPTIGINYLEPIKAKGISTIWLQPRNR
ncbi:CoA-binding protein [Erysipelothrix sp. D19-032]